MQPFNTDASQKLWENVFDMLQSEVLLLDLCQGEPGEQKNGVAEGDQMQRPQRRRFWRPYRR